MQSRGRESLYNYREIGGRVYKKKGTYAKLHWNCVYQPIWKAYIKTHKTQLETSLWLATNWSRVARWLFFYDRMTFFYIPATIETIIPLYSFCVENGWNLETKGMGLVVLNMYQRINVVVETRKSRPLISLMSLSIKCSLWRRGSSARHLAPDISRLRSTVCKLAARQREVLLVPRVGCCRVTFLVSRRPIAQ